jgi:excinuclease ABC subunit C
MPDGVNPLKERLKNVPLKPGVYMYKDAQGQVIYVGKARELRNRMRSYFQSRERLHPRVRAMMNRVADFDYIVSSTEVEALILENNLIKAYQPRYNIDLRDDKSYPYLKVGIGDKFPGISIVREDKDGVSKYFGPYTDVGSLKETLKLLSGIFPLRKCRNFKQRPRPCLNSDIGKCLAPCSGQVSEEEYRRMVDDLLAFLEGEYKDILKSKEAEMKDAALQLEFEKAARIRDQIRAIEKIGEKQKVIFESAYNLDLLAMASGEKESLLVMFKVRTGKITAKETFTLNRAVDENEAELMGFFIKQYYHDNTDIPAEILLKDMPAEADLIETWLQDKSGFRVKFKNPRRGEKKKMLDMVLENTLLLWEEKNKKNLKDTETLIHLSKVLDLQVIPERIECYDISHLAGEEVVASMVVFSSGQADKKAYRRFKIINEKNDDFASLAETLGRRFEEADRGNTAFLPEPDLIIIDGGLGQVNAVKKEMERRQIDIPVFGLAKKNEEIFAPGISQPVLLPRRDEGLRLLQRMRDEAHRFAIEYNRQRRAKKLKVSALDNIEGIGPKRKKALLAHFGSVAKIKEASLEEIASVAGINLPAARNVYEYFQSS